MKKQFKVLTATALAATVAIPAVVSPASAATATATPDQLVFTNAEGKAFSITYDQYRDTLFEKESNLAKLIAGQTPKAIGITGKFVDYAKYQDLIFANTNLTGPEILGKALEDNANLVPNDQTAGFDTTVEFDKDGKPVYKPNPTQVDKTAYEAALAKVTKADYTEDSWAKYQEVVKANAITETSTQEEVDAATAAITKAQADLVKVAVKLTVESVSAITATSVTVAITAPTKDLVDQTVEVKNVGGQVVSTKSATIKAGATTATFEFTAPLTVNPTAGWTVNGVAYSPVTFEIVSVEPLTDSAKHLSVQFNKALTSLDASEVAVRDAVTLERKGIEKVVLSSDGLSAQVTLLGDDTSGTQILTSGRDYTLTVTQKGNVTSGTFEVPKIIREKDVTSYDLTTRLVSTTSGQFKVPTSIAFDFEELKGREITAWVNKNGDLIKYVASPQTVKLSAVKFTIDGTDKYVNLTGTTEKYLLATDAFISLDDSDVKLTNISDKLEYDYAEILFNKAGAVDRILAYNFDASILAQSVSGTAVLSYGDEVNFKDYRIVKNGKTVAVADIKPGDVVNYNSAKKYAEVYTSKVTGPIQAVYNAEYKFNDKVYPIANAKSITNNKVASLTQEGIESLKASGKDVTVYFDRKGNAKLLVGEVGAVVSTTAAGYLTENARFYQDKGYDFLELKYLTSNGATATETININTLSYINEDAVTPTHQVGKGTPAVAKFVVDNEKNIDSVTATGSIVSNDIKTPVNFAKGSIVEVIKNATGEVVGLNFGNKDVTGADAKPTDTTVKVDGSPRQITASTPVFWLDDKTDATKVTPSVTTWGDLANKKITKIDSGKATVYFNKTTGVVDYVVAKASDVPAESQTKEATLVIADVRKDTDNNVAYLKLFNGTTVSEYTIQGKIADNAATPYAVGDVVIATVNKDNELQVSKLDKKGVTTGSIVKNSVVTSEEKFSILDNGTQKDFAKPVGGNVLVYEKVGTGSNVTLEARNFSALFDIKATNEVNVYTTANKVANVVVITKNDATLATSDNTNGTVKADYTKDADNQLLKKGQVRFTADAIDAADTIHSVVLKAVGKTTATITSTQTVTAPAGKNKWDTIYTFTDLLKTAADGTANFAQTYTVTPELYEVVGTKATGSATPVDLIIAKDIVAKASSNTVTIENNFGETTTAVIAKELLTVEEDGKGKANATGINFAARTDRQNYNVAVTKVNGSDSTGVASASIKAETTANDGKIKFTVTAPVTSFEVKIVVGGITVTLEATAANGNVTAWSVLSISE